MASAVPARLFQSHLAAQQREYLVGPLHDILAARVFFGIFRFGIALFALNSHIIIALQCRLMAGCIHAAGTQQHQRGTQRADAGFPKRHGSISQRRATGRLSPELAKIQKHAAASGSTVIGLLLYHKRRSCAGALFIFTEAV